jgi:DNA-binding CsgD family transcriptional regulator
MQAVKNIDEIQELTPCDEILTFLCETASDGILVTDRMGMIMSANQAIEALLGYNVSELVNTPLETYLPTLPYVINNGNVSRTTTVQSPRFGNISLEVTYTAFRYNGAPANLFILHRLPPLSEHNPLSKLSSRETQIMRLVSHGYTSREIGEKLNISTKTVERHRANLMTKLSTRNVAQLVRIALENGID